MPVRPSAGAGAHKAIPVPPSSSRGTKTPCTIRATAQDVWSVERGLLQRTEQCSTALCYWLNSRHVCAPAVAVWEFYASAPKLKWRGKLALVLFELQQMGHAGTSLQQMLNAMARVHVSTLGRLLRGLWLPSNPLLLVRTLEEVAAQNLSCQAVFAMVTQSDVRALKQQPPASLAETEAAVTALLLHASSQPAASRVTPMVAQGSTTATRRNKRKRRVVITESCELRDAQLQEETEAPEPCADGGAYKAVAAGKEAAELLSDDRGRISSPASLELLATAADESQCMVLDNEAETPQGVSTQPPPASTATIVHDDIDADTNMDAVFPGEVVASSAAPLFADEHGSAKERQHIDAALQSSLADLRKRPLAVLTPEQRRAYAVHVEQQLQDRRLALRIVPGNGDCILASVLLGCEAIGIDVCAEQAKLASPAHASHLRVFLADWIREHRQVLFDISGGDDSWRGDAVAIRKLRRGGIRCRPAAATRLTLDGCLDLRTRPNAIDTAARATHSRRSHSVSPFRKHCRARAFPSLRSLAHHHR